MFDATGSTARNTCRLRKSITTVAISCTLMENPQAAATAGCDGPEIVESDLLCFARTSGDVFRIAAIDHILIPI